MLFVRSLFSTGVPFGSVRGFGFVPIYVHMRDSQNSNALIALFRNLNALTLDKRGLFQVNFGNERKEVFQKNFLMDSHPFPKSPSISYSKSISSLEPYYQKDENTNTA